MNSCCQPCIPTFVHAGLCICVLLCHTFCPSLLYIHTHTHACTRAHTHTHTHTLCILTQVIPQSTVITVGSSDPVTEQPPTSSSSTDRDKSHTTQNKITVRSSYDRASSQSSKPGDTRETASRPKVHSLCVHLASSPGHSQFFNVAL